MNTCCSSSTPQVGGRPPNKCLQSTFRYNRPVPDRKSNPGKPLPPKRSRDLATAIRNVYRGRLTQIELADRLGVAQNTVSRWSTGEVEPSLEQIAAIEKACGVERGFILRAAGYVVESFSPDALIARDARLEPSKRELLVAAYKAALRQSRRS